MYPLFVTGTTLLEKQIIANFIEVTNRGQSVFIATFNRKQMSLTFGNVNGISWETRPLTISEM